MRRPTVIEQNLSASFFAFLISAGASTPMRSADEVQPVVVRYRVQELVVPHGDETRLDQKLQRPADRAAAGVANQVHKREDARMHTDTYGRFAPFDGLVRGVWICLCSHFPHLR